MKTMTTIAAALAAVAMSLTTAGAAHAVNGGPDPCDPAARPAHHQRVEYVDSSGVDHDNVTRAHYACSPLTGTWVAVEFAFDQWKTYGPSKGCQIFFRQETYRSDHLGPWALVGHYTSC